MTTPERLRRRQRVEGVVLVIIGLIMVVQQQYWQHQQSIQDAKDVKQDAKQEALTIRNTELTECLAQLTVQITASSAARSEPLKRKDAALITSMEAMIAIVQDRVVQQEPDSYHIQRNAEKFIKEATEFIEQQRALDVARDHNPTPEFRDFCPKVAGTEITRDEEKANNERANKP